MKLLLIMAVEEYEKEVKNILKNTGVQTFSVQPAKGYKNTKDADLLNWFVSEEIATESLLYTVFVEDSCMEDIFEKIDKFNNNVETLTHIHIASIGIEKFL
jgi:nitrogen regulatory protein PII